MKYNDISDSPKQGWKYANDLEMQKASSKMICEKLCLRPEAIFDLFQKAKIKISDYFNILIPDNLKKRIKTIDVIMECIMNDTTNPLKDYLKISY